MAKLFVWDLHGTLERGNERAVIEISNVVLERAGFAERFSDADAFRLYGRKWHEYFAWLLPGEPEDRWFTLQDACFKFSAEDVEIQGRWMRPAPHAHAVLRAIGKHHDQVVVSNTRPHNLLIFLERLGLTEFFPVGRRLGVDNHARRGPSSKTDALHEYMATQGTMCDQIIVIGDSTSDIDLARASHGVSYLYDPQGDSALAPMADVVVRDLRGVLRAI
jgi:phosphoglycolate phosphatase-like HAD superfamily hydrolase